jgi:DNA-directed RNA polymerase subunit RPC12/RpoP
MSEREELKKSLLAKYEKFLDKMFDDLPSVGEASLSDLERATGDLGAKLVQNTLQSLVSQETEAEEKEVPCPDCGGKSHRRGKKGKQVISSQGEIEIERQYYLCANCKKGFFFP